MILQMRIYTINRHELQNFADAWLHGVYPLRLKHGFIIPNAWVMKQTNQFVWLLGYEGPESWEVKEQAYYDSPERLRLDPDPVQYIARVEEYFVQPVVS